MVIGVVGGMGSYATLHFFKRYLEVFSAVKEWDRPRIIIDNRCTMPSRVRAILYNEKFDQVVSELSESIINLKNAGCSSIVLACNTSHVFLPYILKKHPELEPIVENIIVNCSEEIVRNNDIKEKISLIATEGTIESNIYQNTMQKDGINIQSPSEELYKELRMYIEAVKQNDISETCLKKFKEFIHNQPSNILIAGCTEFPVLIDYLSEEDFEGIKIYDPLEITLKKLHTSFLKESRS